MTGKAIREAIRLNKPAEVTGRVRVDYTNPATGRVLERLEKKNTAFGGSFDTTNYVDYLNQTSYDSLFVTDDNTPADPSFPYLRGKILGYGRTGTAGDGVLRGSYIAAQSELDIDMDNGRGRRWTFAYDFGGSQLNGNIGAIGLTQQYLTTYNSNTLLYPARRRKFTAPTNNYAFKGDRGIRAVSNAGVSKYFPFTNTTQAIAVAGVSAGSYYAAGYNADDDRAYIYVYSSTASLRNMYEFADDTFATPLNVYPMTTHTNTALYGCGVFTVKGGKLWYYYNGWKRVDFANNGAEASIVSPACAYNAALYNTYAYAMPSADGSKLFAFKDIQSASRIPVIDLETEAEIATMGTSLRYSGTSTYYGAWATDPADGNGQTLIGFANHSPNLVFGLKQALTCYALPGDAPARPDGSGVMITYRLEVRY